MNFEAKVTENTQPSTQSCSNMIRKKQEAPNRKLVAIIFKVSEKEINLLAYYGK